MAEYGQSGPAPTARRSVWKHVLAAAAFLVLFLWGMRASGEAAGNQQGNFLAFIGSLVMSFPAMRQMWTNRPYAVAAETEPVNESLKAIKLQLKDKQVVTFVRFSWLDAICYACGALVLAGGFLLQVLGWKIPI
jgi:hypothetical protein